MINAGLLSVSGFRVRFKMNVNDLHKVWEIRTLKRKVGGDEARKFLEKIAKQVQPIMRKHKWRVKVLSEMWYESEPSSCSQIQNP